MSTSLPTPQMQQGDYSQLTDNQNRSITLYNPYSTTDKAQNYSRTPYPGNVIPLSQRSPFAAYYYSMMPQPNQPNINPSVSANYFGPDPLRQDDWTFTTRIDHRLGEKDQIFGRFTVGNRLLVNRRTSSNTAPVSLDKFWNYQSDTERMNTAAFTWNHIFSPTFFMETLVTGARMNWRFDLQGGNTTGNLAAKLGLPNPFDVGGAPNLTAMGFDISGVGTIPRFDDTKPVTVEQNLHARLGKASVRVRLALSGSVPGRAAGSTRRGRHLFRQPGDRPLRSRHRHCLQLRAPGPTITGRISFWAWLRRTPRRCRRRSITCVRSNSPATCRTTGNSRAT